MAFPNHINSIIKNRTEIQSLLDIHKQLAGNASKKKHNLEVLHKSAIVLLVACWEAYVEDLADLSFDFLMKNAKSPNDFPKKVLSIAGSSLKADKNDSKIWDLAGEGWRKTLFKHQEKVKNRYIGKLNTPRPKQIDEMFENLIGIKNISKQLKWQGAPNKNVIERLDKLITLRGEIAHRVATSKPVRKSEVVQNLNFIGYLSVKLSNIVSEYLWAQTQKDPWTIMSYGAVK